MWATTYSGGTVLLDAEPVSWQAGVYRFIDDEVVVRAVAGTDPPYFACHWESCQDD